MKIYNVGILGFGMIGKVHAYGYRNLPLFYDPAAASGADRLRRDQPAGDCPKGEKNRSPPTRRRPISAP